MQTHHQRRGENPAHSTKGTHRRGLPLEFTGVFPFPAHPTFSHRPFLVWTGWQLTWDV